MIPDLDTLGGPFSTVFDVGGFNGEFAEAASRRWPGADITSFEPVPESAEENRSRAKGRWGVMEVALTDGSFARDGVAVMHRSVHFPDGSTMQEPGPTRLGLMQPDTAHEAITVKTARLDEYTWLARRPLLVKVDVEGHEREVLHGGWRVLSMADTVLVEVQNDPRIFLGAPRPWEVDLMLRQCGLMLSCLAGAFVFHGKVLQFDGVWKRDAAS